MGNDERVIRSVMGNNNANEIGFGWIGLGWCDLDGDAISMVVRDIWRCRCWGAGSAGAGVRSVLGGSVTLSSFSLSLRVWDLEMVCSENRNVNQFPGQSHKTHGQLKCLSGKFYFPCATKHVLRCKIISWNGFTPKQTQHKKNKPPKII